MRIRPRKAWAAGALALAGCMQVTVTGSGRHAPAKPPDCAVRFLEQRPEIPSEDLGELRLEAGANAPGRALDAMRERACALGADAVVVTQGFERIGDSAVMQGIAIRFLDAKLDPLRPPATPR